MNPLLKEIQVTAGRIVKITHPVTQEVLKVFKEGEAIVEAEWNLVDGFLEANLAGAVKVIYHTPVVTAETLSPPVAIPV